MSSYCTGCVIDREATRLREENAKLIAQRDELRDAIMSLLVAKDEKEYHGDTPVYQSLKRSAWKKARAAITNATININLIDTN